MSINWYPGHMKKTKDLIDANLKLVDVVIELLDARIPISSRNPQFDQLIGHKKRVVALNKYDLADPHRTKLWIQYYAKIGIKAIPINSLNGEGLGELINEAKASCTDVIEKAQRQGRLLRPIRAMIVGIPNVGKSSLINKLAGKNAAKTGNKPGVTRGKQWIRLNKEVELFDTPGILWPKIEEDLMGIKLACSGAIKDEVLNIEDIAYNLIVLLLVDYRKAFYERYKLDESIEDVVEIMTVIGRKRGCLVKGNEVDLEKASRLIVDEFRKGQIGRITLEIPSLQSALTSGDTNETV
ncbi:MAG TPA: ribosome biogenesis GTPase YlqF [Clostridiales bacterium UBA8960]|nr:ribosome biogenesis GTPase YlqF [Clostridiales bacterium UBA8960]